MGPDFPKQEKKILKFWKENRIFERSIKQRAKARDFVFYEGPPTANAKAGLHHVLSRVYKDIICRYKTMNGFRVLRKAGWDTHGLPVEIEIEKKLGLKSKKDIEKYGTAKFNKRCKESVWRYKQDWEKLTERIGYWLDMEHPYITYENYYIESVWWLLKQIWQKGLLEQDYKVVPYCPRCGTSLSSHEVAQGYKKIKEPSIYIKFQVLSPKLPNSYLLVWTTTPWTLPGNVAVAVNPEFVYVRLKVGNEYLILEKERMEQCGIKAEIIEEFKGKDLLGLEYQPLYRDSRFKIQSASWRTRFKIISGDFVSLDEGTGLVHIAPAFGEDDMRVGKENSLPVLMTVDEQGRFEKEIRPWAGMFVKEADPLIIEDLKKRDLLFKEELYEHDYPFCWRCKTPLIYYAKKSWFIRMQRVKEKLIENNQKINWIPSYLKEGRFGEWLKELKDWAISRERYWGTPLPIWRCKDCGHQEIIGSKKDLSKQKFSTNIFFIFRHGHSVRQVKKLACCWPEKFHCPLTEKGKKEVKRNAQKLKNKKIGLIFSSDSLRAKQTAEVISREIGAEIVFDKRLREFNVGIFNAEDPKLTWGYLSKKKDRGSARLPEGESLADVRERMYKFLKEINKRYQNKNILIVSHELPLSFLEKTLMGWPIERILEWRGRGEGMLKPGFWKKIDFRILPLNKKMELDFHRPFIDEVKFECPKCDGLMQRVLEVIDCWFDSGAMPFAQAYWPFTSAFAKASADKQNKKLAPYRNEVSGAGLKPPELFPADYICEGVDQTRGWFYTLLAISTLLGFGSPYKNVISVSHVLDEKGEKMSKSKGNVVDPWYIAEKYGADATRWYFYTVNQPGDSKFFSEKDVEQALKKFIMTFWNIYSFFQTYVIDFRRSAKICYGGGRERGSRNILDRWIISKLNRLVLEITERLDKYDITWAAREMESFVIDDLSLWYIRRSRKRFQRPDSAKELKEAADTLGLVLLTLSKLGAPFVPFLSEKIYRDVGSNLMKSVHLEEWPKTNKKLIDKELEEKMKMAREVVAEALAQRARAGIKVRQPLLKLKIKDLRFKTDKELLELIKEELNVKEIIFDSKIKAAVELDTEITTGLREEGTVREVIRQIQEMRKRAGYKPRHRILIRYFGEPEINKILSRNKDFILKEIRAEDFLPGDRPKRVFDIEKEVVINGQKLWLGIRKI